MPSDYIIYETDEADENEISHHGILGMHWGIRRTPEELGHLTRQDRRFVRRKSDKIMRKAEKASKKELRRYEKFLYRGRENRTKDGHLTAAAVNSYNRRMAELMTEKVSDLRSPSGKLIQFVAKRGEVGVFMALTDEGYDIGQLRQGIWSSGRIAYRKTVVNQIGTDGKEQNSN